MSVITIKAPAGLIEDIIEKRWKQLTSTDPSRLLPWNTYLNPEWKDEVRTTLQRMAEANEAAFRSVTKMSWVPKDRVNVNGDFHTFTKEMRLNPVLFTKEGKRAAAASQQMRWHVPRLSDTHTHTADGTAIHELGHAVHSNLTHAQELRLYKAASDELGGDWDKYGLPMDSEMTDDQNLGSMLYGQFSPGLDRWFEKEMSWRAKAKLSTYGGSNRMEFLAEVYVNWKTQGVNAKPIARRLGPMMDEMLK
jgi:hypothetical protein